MNETNSLSASLESTISIPACFVKVFGATDTGMVRDHNEDNFVLADLTARVAGVRPEILRHRAGRHGSLFMVADGMGGGAAGEVASQLAVNHVYHKVSEGVRSFPELDKLTFARQLKTAVEYANGVIYQESINNPVYKGMGTTASAAGLFQETLFIAQVGDSRAYLIRNGVIRQITKDQSLVNKLLDAGLITEEEAESHENKNVILQALGIKETVDVIVSTIDVKQADILILCSDGLSGLVKAEEIKQVVESSPDQAAACHTLIATANQRGGHDNITVIIAQFSGDALSTARPEDTIEYQVVYEAHEETAKSARPSEVDVDTREIPKVRAVPMPAEKPPVPWLALSIGLLAVVALVAVLYWMFPTGSGGGSSAVPVTTNSVPPSNPPSGSSPRAMEGSSPKIGESVSTSLSAVSGSPPTQKPIPATTPPLKPEKKPIRKASNSSPKEEEGTLPPAGIIEPVSESADPGSQGEPAGMVKVEFRVEADLADLIRLGPTGLPINAPLVLKPGFYQLPISLEKTTCLLPVEVRAGKANLFSIRKDVSVQGECHFRIEMIEN